MIATCSHARTHARTHTAGSRRVEDLEHADGMCADGMCITQRAHTQIPNVQLTRVLRRHAHFATTNIAVLYCQAPSRHAHRRRLTAGKHREHSARGMCVSGGCWRAEGGRGSEKSEETRDPTTKPPVRDYEWCKTDRPSMQRRDG